MSNDTEFKWTVDLLAEFIRDYVDKDGTAAELMEQFKESKQPKELLFTTEDRVDIYKDYSGKISTVYEDFSFNYDCPMHQILSERDTPHHFTIKYFSTKEAAREFILNNKPQFSLHEITTIGNVEDNNPYYKKLVALAESKLK